MVINLIIDNQYSVSPKARTAIIFIANISKVAMPEKIQEGTWGNQN
ncbi:hypothetical protein C426_1595 [Lactococcus garvieae DCC43]|uniref:Uncharacterized protein n=1 Tax=Lactococcus garvieae DCC43 TaxID=1231377 RepID=K2NU71_9LACT|nr:hypothetical protein C426_1595 [Lactococcus garvieae DCC43]